MKKLICYCILLFLLSGCGKDASSMTVVTGIGLDGTPGYFRATAEAIQLSDSQEEKSESVLIRSDGVTLTDSLQNTVALTGRPLHCNHVQVIILGRETAEKDVEIILEDILRQSQYPVSAELAVTKGQASDLMEKKPVVGDLGSTELKSLIVQGEKQCSNPASTAAEFYQDVCAPGIEGILPFVDLRQNGDDTVRKITGTAIFRNMEMQSVLDTKESRCLLWLRGKTGGTFIGDTTVFEVLHLKRNISADETGAKVCLTVTLRADSNSGEKAALIEEAEAQLAENCRLLLTVLQKQKCDAVGFGNCIYRRQPKKWRDLQYDWPEIFEKIPIEVEVHVKNITWGRIWSTDGVEELEAQNGK